MAIAAVGIANVAKLKSFSLTGTRAGGRGRANASEPRGPPVVVILRELPFSPGKGDAT